MTRKMDRVAAGRLGGLSWGVRAKREAEERRAKYDLNPVLCRKCFGPIRFSLRNKNIFCSLRCSRSMQPRRKKILSCTACGKQGVYRKYCSLKCQREHNYKTKVVPRVIAGEAGKGALRTYLSREFGYNCSECSTSSWNGKPLTLHLDHIDGDSDNNKLSNVRLLCPNCHSQTPTYTGRNKKASRRSVYYANRRDAKRREPDGKAPLLHSGIDPVRFRGGAPKP